VYPFIARWIWNKEGFLRKMGHLDFAGGTVVHVNVGVSALVICKILGKRTRNLVKDEPSSLKLMLLGTAILWFGWLGFNGGNSCLNNPEQETSIETCGANFRAVNAVSVTNISACSAGLAWLFIDWSLSEGNVVSLKGVAFGVISGLVGSTPLAGFVDL